MCNFMAPTSKTPQHLSPPAGKRYTHLLSTAVFLLFLASFLSGNDATIGQDLSLALGQKRLTTHALLETSIKESSEIAGFFTICSDYDQADTTQRYLASKLGDDYSHPLYLSARENTACFVAIVDDSTVADLGNLEFIRSRTLTPPQLKIHESAFSLVELTRTDLSASSIQENQYLRAIHRSGDSSVLSRTKLVVTFGVGVVNKHGVVNDRQGDLNIHAVQRKLAQRNPTQDLSSFMEDATRHIDQGHQSLSVWENAIQDFNLFVNSPRRSSEATLCPDHLLSLEFMTPSQLVIGNIVPFLDAIPTSYRQSCVLSLFSHFLTTYSPMIANIHLRFPKHTTNHKNKGIVQAKTFSESYPYHDVGLDGTGQIVGIGDTGIDELSCFFRNSDSSKVARSTYDAPTFDLSKRKVIQYIAYGDDIDLVEGHGTHVAGTVAGNPEDVSMTKQGGHAPGAKIAFFDMEGDPDNGIDYPSPLGQNVFQPAYDAGARIHSNSWGGPFNAYFDDDSFSADSFQYSHPDFLALFSAGNEGAEGFYSIGEPASTKNSLTVGASGSNSAGDMSSVAYFSSLGPTFDERIKPDVVAPGYFTSSAFSNPAGASCSVVDMAGTSMATPLVAGVAAQLRQYFETYGTLGITTGCSLFIGSGALSSTTCDNLNNPRGATIKAMIIHSGEPMAEYNSEGEGLQPTITLTETPDMYQGFGRVALPNVLPCPGIETILKLHVVETEIYSYQQITHIAQVNDISRPFKATIVWMDPDNTVMSHKMLLNNLDLKVITPSGDILHGNNIAGDEVNNVEQVSVLTPEIGSYTVVITSAHLVTSSQDFSLIVTGGALAFSSHVASAANTIDYNPNGCGVDERNVVLTVTDRGGDGWGAENSFEIRDSTDSSLVFSGTLLADAGQQFRKTIPLCLPSGKSYSVALIGNGDNSDEMGLDISPCNTYLSKHMTSSTFSISSASSLYCGGCPGEFDFEVTLYGSIYGVPYGWKQETHYSLWNPDSDSHFVGTLVTGMVDLRHHCLASGTWYLEFSDVAEDDDGLIDDDYIAYYAGTREYFMVASNGVSDVTIRSGERVTLSVTGASASMSTGAAGPTLSPTISVSPTFSPTTKPTKEPKPKGKPKNPPTTPTPTLDATPKPTKEPKPKGKPKDLTPTVRPSMKLPKGKPKGEPKMPKDPKSFLSHIGGRR